MPYPQDIAKFWQLVALGSQLRAIHLLESPLLETYITQYPVDGDNTITKIQAESTTPCPPLEEVAQSAGGGLSLDSKTQPETYPPSPLRVLPPKGDSKIALNCPPRRRWHKVPEVD